MSDLKSLWNRLVGSPFAFDGLRLYISHFNSLKGLGWLIIRNISLS